MIYLTICFDNLQVLGSNGGVGVNLDFCGAGKEDPTTFFNDGVRKIDFVLVFEETLKSEDDFDTAGLAPDAKLLCLLLVN